VRSSPLTARATCTLPTVIPLPRGPASSKALSRPSNKWSWDIDDAKFSPLRGRVGRMLWMMRRAIGLKEFSSCFYLAMLFLLVGFVD